MNQVGILLQMYMSPAMAATTPSPSFNFSYLFYLRGRERGAGTFSQNACSSGAKPILRAEDSVGHPCKRQKLNYLNHCLLSPKMCISNNLEWGVELGLELEYRL